MAHFLSERSAKAGSPQGHCATENCLILQYRRVALLSHDPLRLAVQPCNFERQMEYLAANCNVISMDDVKWHLHTATPFKDHSVVVTFDGGYADVLYTARDVLWRFDIPATVFVPTAGLIEKTHFWWDALEDAVIAGGLRDRLEIDLDGQRRCWPLLSQGDRFRAFDDLYEILSGKTPPEQREIVAEIAAGREEVGRERDNHAMLGIQELKTLGDDGLITIGGYTHNVTMLSMLAEPEQMAEVGRNKQILEEILGRRIEYFAYPFGDEEWVTGSTVGVLKQLGFALSCRLCPDAIHATGSLDLFGLPRLMVGDWNPFTFYRRLKSFLD